MHKIEPQINQLTKSPSQGNRPYMSNVRDISKTTVYYNSFPLKKCKKATLCRLHVLSDESVMPRQPLALFAVSHMVFFQD